MREVSEDGLYNFLNNHLAIAIERHIRLAQNSGRKGALLLQIIHRNQHRLGTVL